MRYERGSFITVPSKEVLRGLPSNVQTLYMWLCSYANETGNCFPSRNTLASDCGCSIRTIDATLKLLEESELIEKENRYSNNEKSTNLYSVIIRGGRAKSALGRAKSALPLEQNLRIELNPIRTKSTELLREKIEVVKLKEKDTERESYADIKGYATNRVKPIREWGEKESGAKYPNPIVQETAIAKCLSAGYSEKDIKSCFSSLFEDKFWGEKGFDFTTVIGQIGKAKKKKPEIISKYAKYA